MLCCCFRDNGSPYPQEFGDLFISRLMNISDPERLWTMPSALCTEISHTSYPFASAYISHLVLEIKIEVHKLLSKGGSTNSYSSSSSNNSSSSSSSSTSSYSGLMRRLKQLKGRSERLSMYCDKVLEAVGLLRVLS